MTTRFRNVLQVTVAALALGGGATAAADGIAGRMAERARGQAQQQQQQQQQQRSEPRRESRPTQRAESRPAQRTEARPAQRSDVRQSQRGEVRSARTSPSQQRFEKRERESRQSAAAASPVPATQAGTRSSGSGDRGVVGALVQREYQTRDPRDNDGRGGRDNDGRNGDGRGDRDRDRDRDRYDRDDNGRDWDRDTNANRDRDDRRDAWRDRDRDDNRDRYRDRRHVHVIHHLPSGYRDYWWNGSRYYYHGGYWYRPQGTSFISVGVPYGLFVTTLPGAYSSVWVSGTRYYYSDHHYYTWEPARRGYVVVRSPYGEEEYEDSRLDQDLYIYPAQGQSEQQQADDRYECHRWAVDETDYDPIDDEYDADLHEDYLRAMTACLTGRGYTVR